MKAMIRHVQDGEDTYDVLMIWCPAIDESSDGECGLHMLPISGDGSRRPVWGFDGNLEAPTLTPSILTRMNYGDLGIWICHSFIRAGKWEFLPDCTHSMAGQTVDTPELPSWVVDR